MLAALTVWLATLYLGYVAVQACMSLRVDLITFNFTRRLPFRLKPTLLQAAVDRGVHFEVCSPARLRAHTAFMWAPCLRKQSAALNF